MSLLGSPATEGVDGPGASDNLTAARPAFLHTRPQICTRFDHNFIDGESGKDYRARQIEPRSLRTLRLSGEGAASLTAVAPRN
jgi:hypothetical protein